MTNRNIADAVAGQHIAQLDPSPTLRVFPLSSGLTWKAWA